VKVLENRIVSDRCRSGQLAVRNGSRSYPQLWETPIVPSKPLHLVAGEDFELPALPGRALPSRSYTETFYDTAGGRLDRAGFALRRRVENGKGIWRLTVTSDGDSALEVEALGGPKAPPAELEELISAASAGFAVSPVARLRTHAIGRRVKRGSHTLAKVHVASVAVLDGSRVSESFNELTLEPLAADRKELRQIEKALRGAGAKRSHGRRRVPAPVAPYTHDESPADNPGLERLRLFFGEQYARILAHDPGVRIGRDPEELHQLRVATRRLRSVLRTARRLLDQAWAGALRDELTWLGGELGPVRDADVMLEHLRQEAAGLDPADRRALRPLLNQLGKEQAAGREQALAALRSERYFALLATLESAASTPPPGDDVSLVKAARKEFERLAKAMAELVAEPSDDAVHRARIKGKRARYAAELVEGDLGKAGSKLVSATKRFQDVAGEHQDSVVAEDRIRALLGGTRSQRLALAAGILVAREHERRARAVAALPDAWSRVEQAAAKAWS
jgi:CHAD domain-containing protein